LEDTTEGVMPEIIVIISAYISLSYMTGSVFEIGLCEEMGVQSFVWIVLMTGELWLELNDSSAGCSAIM
jgi:hypothetical protein